MELRFGRRRVAVSNQDKVLYPAGHFTKRQVIEYYVAVGQYLLPHLRKRPVTLVRFPDGPFGGSFYEKNLPAFAPDWIKTAPVPRSEGGVIRYILIEDLATLAWTANLAALELHPFLHRAPDIDTPTHVVFDLDPGEGANILNCAEVGFLVRDLLARLELQCFPKVSGSKGLQIYVPLNRPVTYQATGALAQAVAGLLARQHPDLVVSEMSKALRAGKVFIDWSQNSRSKTTVAVYSLRAKRERPLVSMPVSWDELKRAARASAVERLYFEPKAALARLRKLGDLFEPVLRLKQSLPPGFLDSALAPPPPKSLARYGAKRDFSKTSEPAPVVARRSAQGGRRRFVIQQHAARQLHFDLRLEMHDALKSWAVPKGMPLQRGERHSAFATEDHPLEYLDFEGIIPAGQYGGGTVMVWDIGTYEPVQGNYYQGQLTIFLSGQKLKGEWTLKRLRAEGEHDGKQQWLLIKTGADARPISARRLARSALTDRTLQQIAEEQTAVWHSNRPAQAASHGRKV